MVEVEDSLLELQAPPLWEVVYLPLEVEDSLLKLPQVAPRQLLVRFHSVEQLR